MDFFPALAAVSPTPPAPGKGSSNEAPAGDAASDFSAHMLQADTGTSGPEQAAPLPSESGPLSGSTGSDSGHGRARARQVEPRESDPEVPDGDAPALGAGLPEIQAPAEAAMAGEPSIAPSRDGQAAAIGPAITAARKRVEAKVTGRPDAGNLEASVAEPGRERPTPAPSPGQLVPPPDPQSARTGRNEVAESPQLKAGPASTDGGAKAPGPAAAPDPDVTTARQSPPQTLEARIARGAGDTPGAPPPAAGVSPTEPSGATGPSEQRRTPSGGNQVDRAIEPRRALARREGADGGDQVLLQEKPSAPEDPFGSQIRATDPGPTRPSSDPQPSRLPQISNLHGNAIASPHPAASVSVEVAQVTVRAPEGAAGTRPTPHSATQQVALQITKALDQDRTEIRIRLDPPELGEVDIQLEFRGLRLAASINVERPDTLDLLQRDSRSLVRALREAGLELGDSDLSFAQDGGNDRSHAGSYAQRGINLPHPLPTAAPLQDRPLAQASPDAFVSLSDGRMDLRV